MGYPVSKKKKTTAIAKAAPVPPSATALHRCVVAAVSAADRDAANVILLGVDPSFQSFYVPHPAWDGITPPQPPPDAYGQRMQGRIPVVELYVQGLEACKTAGLDLLYWEGVVLQAERNIPQNTLDSIYDTGFNPALPVRDGHAGVALWFLETTGQLPPRESFDTPPPPV
jgi:hypothetical protein